VGALLQASAERKPSRAIPEALSNLSGGFSSKAFGAVGYFFISALSMGLLLAFFRRDRAARLVEAADKFGLNDPITNGQPPTIQRTVLGGVVTAAALLVAFLLACYYLINALSLDNVTVLSSIGVLHDGMLDDMAASGAPWLRAPPYEAARAGGAAEGRDGSFSGLQVRVLAMGEPGRCAEPLRWKSRGGLKAGAWELEAASASPPLLF
jgi:hypothetical protein